MEEKSEMQEATDNLIAAVEVLKRTVDHWDMAEDDLPIMLKEQAH